MEKKGQALPTPGLSSPRGRIKTTRRTTRVRKLDPSELQGLITNRQRLIIVIGLVLVLGTLALYWPATNNDFVNYDDDLYAGNGHVQAGLRLDGIPWALTTMEAGNWHPLTWLSLMLDGQLYGSNPRGFH